VKKRKITLSYIIFYILFLPDTYRLIMGILAAWFFAPYVVESRPMPREGEFVVWVMIATIGYAMSTRIGNMISDWIKNIILPVRKNG
jgi:prolipoprotein diacylglyceryltransferase